MKLIWIFLLLTMPALAGEPVVLQLSNESTPRVAYGIEKLSTVLKQAGYTITVSRKKEAVAGKSVIRIVQEGNFGKEGFSISSEDKITTIAGTDASGVLYGCLELAERIREDGRLPQGIAFSDKPEMVLRGTCIGIQKPYYLPGRTVYEYPYTPETFPWFYDKELWVQYLDSLAANRFNSLYLWNGHPFASLVKLKEYPYAVEVDDITFKRNEEIYRFITEEADKRGIWVIQMFYNIIVSKPFAEKHGIKTQDRERPIMPLIADYTRKSIAAFVKKYPNVGLMVCLGEAMEGVGKDDIEWFTKTIIPGMKDGLKALGKKEEPPIVLRAHDTNAPDVMKAALPLYKNLYTEAKFNGEALTTWAPRGSWAELHRTLSRIGTVQIENVHILANLEPFRYASADFIRKSVQGMHSIYEANGLHLYPQASYWDWPYSADNASPRLLQIERDWLWYKQWSRYAWNSRRDSAQESAYWSRQIASKFGCSEAEGKAILRAYEESGEIAPKLLRRFGITDGNRQTLTLGMLMTQLINPHRYNLFTLMYESESPEGEMLIDYAAKEWKKEKHIGETPVQIIREVTAHGNNAVAALEGINVSRHKEEFERIRNDMRCYKALADHFAQKATAALHVLRYKYSHDLHDLEKALPALQQSVQHYRELAALTKDTYLYANSMQTAQRKIPIRGVDATFKTWVEVLVPFEEELRIFEDKLDSLRSAQQLQTTSTASVQLLHNAAVKHAGKSYVINPDARVFSDSSCTIDRMAPELAGLKGILYAKHEQEQKGSVIRFTASEPVNLLVGYFKTTNPSFLKAPELETNAAGNNYGQADIRIANALVVNGIPVNIHTYTFNTGEHELVLAKGACLILGFTAQSQRIKPYDAGLNDPDEKNIDWLFE